MKNIIISFGENVNLFNVCLVREEDDCAIRVVNRFSGDFIMSLPLHSLSFYFMSSIGYVYRLKEHSV